MGLNFLILRYFDFKMSQEEVAVDFSSKTVAELKKECKARNLKMSGVKSDLIER